MSGSRSDSRAVQCSEVRQAEARQGWENGCVYCGVRIVLQDCARTSARVVSQ